MALHKNRDPPSLLGLPIKVVYDINDQTYREWGSPVVTPRDKLLQLLKKAEDAGAATIVVDIDLARTSTGLIDSTGTLTAADRALGEYLRDLNDSKSSERPIVILPRSLRRPADKAIASDVSLLEQVPSFLDQFVVKQKRVFWGTVGFRVDPDGVIRRWQIAEAYCGNDGAATLLPSVQLLAAVSELAPGSTDERAIALQTLVDELRGPAFELRPECSRVHGVATVEDLVDAYPVLTSLLPARLSLAGGTGEPSISATAFGDTRRIVFRVFSDVEQGNKRQIDIRSAQYVLAAQPIGLDALGSTLLIGSSHEDGNDLHRRPHQAELMPGYLVIANAIDTLEQHGDARPASLSWRLLAAIVIINGIWMLLVRTWPMFEELRLAFILATGLAFGVMFIDTNAGSFSVALLPLMLPIIHSKTISSTIRRSWKYARASSAS